MASQNKIIELIGAIKTIYPYYAKETNVPLLVSTWERVLEDYDDNSVDAALMMCLKACKTPPTPADVIEHIRTMRNALEPSDEELWGVYVNALHDANEQIYRFSFTYVDESGISQGKKARQKVGELFDALPGKIRSYIGTVSEFIRLAQTWGADMNFGDYEKPRFLKAMPIVEKRQSYAQLPGGAKKLLLKEE